MNGVHDMGGMHGMGPVVHDKNEPVFHHEWESRTFALNLATAALGKWNIDMGRHSRELMPPAEYLATSYYEHWLWGLEKLLHDAGFVTPEELDARLGNRRPSRTSAPPPGLRMLKAAEVAPALSKWPTARVDDSIAPRFKPGDPVTTRNMQPLGHTRLPRYARGRQGVIDQDHGVWAFPDARAAGQGTKSQHCYSVRFTARELWGPEASERHVVYIDLFEDYLEPA
ncbi:MAG: nitrile hydratase subunit beta [Candidatus Rokuibacteriota bacterium]